MSKFTQADIDRQNAKVAASKRAISAQNRPLAHPDSKKGSRQPKRSKNGYNVDIVLAYFRSHKLPIPKAEFRFHETRLWRFDFAWDMKNRGYPEDIYTNVALEIDGGIWVNGGHNRGAQMLKTWEKENEAACMGWRIIRCQPKDLCTQNTVNLIKRALGINLV